MRSWMIGRAGIILAILFAIVATPTVALASGGDGGPISFRKDAAIWTAIIFVLLFLILWKYAWGPIAQGLAKREDNIANHIAEAEKRHQEAKELLAQYEERLANAAGEVREILEEARRDAEHTQSKIIAAARQEAQAEQNRGLAEIDIAKQQALKELSDAATNLAIDLAGEIVREKLNPHDHQALIQQAVAKYTSEPSQN